MFSPLQINETEMKTTLYFKGIGASVRGSSHYERGIPCQDACRYEQINEDFVICCVADGAGSSIASHISSQLLVNLCIRECKNILVIKGFIPETKKRWHRFMKHVFNRLRFAIAQLVRHQGEYLSYKDFRTTLSLAIVHPQYVIAAQIGDGAIVIQTLNNKLITLCKPKNGEFANQTYFLGKKDNVPKHLQFAFYRRKVSAIALMTDGLTDLALKQAENHSPFAGFFKPLFNIVQNSNDVSDTEAELYAYLYSENICKKTKDDKTLILATFESQASTKPRQMNNLIHTESSISRDISAPSNPVRKDTVHHRVSRPRPPQVVKTNWTRTFLISAFEQVSSLFKR